MSLIDAHIKGGFEKFPEITKVNWFVDADSVLFPHGEAELFEDAERFLDAIEMNRLAIVSSNPNKTLNQKREALVLPYIYCAPESSIVPQWCKYNAYKKAGQKMPATAGTEQAVVIDDRWVMGAILGKCALRHIGYSEVFAYFLDRGLAPNNPLDKALSVIQSAGVQIANFYGFDQLIRPRAKL